MTDDSLAPLPVPFPGDQIPKDGDEPAIPNGYLVILPGHGLLPPPLIADLPQVVYGGHREPSASQGKGQGVLVGILFNGQGYGKVQGSNWTRT